MRPPQLRLGVRVAHAGPYARSIGGAVRCLRNGRTRVLTRTRREGRGVDWGQYLAPLLGLAMIMIDGYDLQSIGYVAPEIARAWSLDIAAFGIVFGAGLAGTIPGAMLAGPAAR